MEHDLRQVIARNCRQRNGSICGRTGSLFFPGIPQRQQSEHPPASRMRKSSIPRVRRFAFMDRSSLSTPQHDHHAPTASKAAGRTMTKSRPSVEAAMPGTSNGAASSALLSMRTALSCPASEAAPPLQEGHIARDDLIMPSLSILPQLTQMTWAPCPHCGVCCQREGPAMSPSAFSVVVIS